MLCNNYTAIHAKVMYRIKQYGHNQNSTWQSAGRRSLAKSRLWLDYVHVWLKGDIDYVWFLQYREWIYYPFPSNLLLKNVKESSKKSVTNVSFLAKCVLVQLCKATKINNDNIFLLFDFKNWSWRSFFKQGVFAMTAKWWLHVQRHFWESLINILDLQASNGQRCWEAYCSGYYFIDIRTVWQISPALPNRISN